MSGHKNALRACSGRGGLGGLLGSGEPLVPLPGHRDSPGSPLRCHGETARAETPFGGALAPARKVQFTRTVMVLRVCYRRTYDLGQLTTVVTVIKVFDFSVLTLAEPIPPKQLNLGQAFKAENSKLFKTGSVEIQCTVWHNRFFRVRRGRTKSAMGHSAARRFSGTRARRPSASASACSGGPPSGRCTWATFWRRHGSAAAADPFGHR